MDILIQQANEIADLYRLGQESYASERYKAFIDELERFLENKQVLHSVSSIFNEMLSAQSRCDWLCLADYLEYELTMELNRYN
jgi:hypothetical protein